MSRKAIEASPQTSLLPPEGSPGISPPSHPTDFTEIRSQLIDRADRLERTGQDNARTTELKKIAASDLGYEAVVEAMKPKPLNGRPSTNRQRTARTQRELRVRDVSMGWEKKPSLWD